MLIVRSPRLKWLLLLRAQRLYSTILLHQLQDGVFGVLQESYSMTRKEVRPVLSLRRGVLLSVGFRFRSIVPHIEVNLFKLLNTLSLL